MKISRLPRIVLTVALAFSPIHHGTAEDKCRTAECEKIKQKIAKIESKMRQGYRSAAGERMTDELRRLRKLRAKYCH